MNTEPFKSIFIKDQMLFFESLYETLRLLKHGPEALGQDVFLKVGFECIDSGQSGEAAIRREFESLLRSYAAFRRAFYKRLDTMPEEYPLGRLTQKYKLTRYFQHAVACTAAVVFYGKSGKDQIDRVTPLDVAGSYSSNPDMTAERINLLRKNDLLFRNRILRLPLNSNNPANIGDFPNVPLLLNVPHLKLLRGGVKPPEKKDKESTSSESHDEAKSPGRFTSKQEATNYASMGTVIEPRVVLDDVVMTPKSRKQVEAAVAQIRKKELLKLWGVSLDRGGLLNMLISGPSGTGKTYLAEAIAYELDRTPLLKVVSSDLISFWLGECERNSTRVFDIARDKGYILMFDEADAFFFRRSEGFAGSDEHMNRMVSALLASMENSEVVVILTTNRPKALDPAFERRIPIRIVMDAPTIKERLELWGMYIPEGLPVADDIDREYLAKRFQLTGGQIKNAVTNVARRLAFRIDTGDGSQVASLDDFKSACKEEAGSAEIFGSAARPVGFIQA